MVMRHVIRVFVVFLVFGSIVVSVYAQPNIPKSKSLLIFPPKKAAKAGSLTIITKPDQTVFCLGSARGGKDTMFQTSLGTLTERYEIIPLECRRSGKEHITIDSGIVRMDSKSALPIDDRVEIYKTGATRRGSITLVQENKSGQWLGTDGALFFDSENVMLMEGDTVRIIGGKDEPVYINNQPFADTTVYIRNGKPYLTDAPTKAPTKADTSCKEDCRRMFEKGELKEGISIEECIKILCND